jgi:hypothetical protein
VVANGDAVGAVVRRTPDALVVTVRYADIERRASPDWGIEFELDIGDHSNHLGTPGHGPVVTPALAPEGGSR